MPTMVQTPELLSPEITGERAVMRPQKVNGLSTFLLDVLPQIQKGKAAYNEQNKDFLIAQGKNDQLYNVDRDVHAFDKYTYSQGREAQKVTSTRASNQKEFLDKVTAMAKAKAPLEEIEEVQREFLAKNVDMISQSGLQMDLKQNAYESNLTDNEVYLKASNAIIAQAKKFNEVFDRNTRVGKTVAQLFLAKDGLEVKQILTSARKDSVGAALAADPTAEPATVDTQVRADTKAVIDFIAERLSITPDDMSVAFVDNFRTAAWSLAVSGEVDINTVNDMLESTGKVVGKVITKNEANSEIDVNNALWEVQSGKVPYTPELVERLTAVLTDERKRNQIGDAYYVRMTSQLNAFGAAEQHKINTRRVSAIDAVTQGLSMTTALAEHDISPEQYQAAVIQKTLAGLKTQDPTVQSGALIERAVAGDANGEYLPDVMKAGVNKASSQIMRFMALDAVAASKQPDYGSSQKQFESLKSTFNALDGRGSQLATDLLAPFGERAPLIAQIFRTGGGMHDAQDSIANPATFAVRQSNFSTALSNLSKINDRPYFGLGAGTIGGTIFHGTSDAAKGVFYTQVEEVARHSPSLTSMQLSSSSDTLVDNMATNGQFMRDPSGYSAMVMTPEALKGFAAPIQGQNLSIYAPNVLSKYRAAVAKEYGISPKNTVVSSDRTGRYFSIIPVGAKGGSKYGGSAGAKVFTIDEIRKDMEDAYNDNIEGRKRNTRTYAVSGGREGERWAQVAGATYGNTSVRDADTGKVTNVTIPAGFGAPFNGNTKIAAAWHAYSYMGEGFITTPRTVKARKGGTDTDGFIIGTGINLAIYRDSKNPEHQAIYKKGMSLAGDPQGIMNFQGELMAKGYGKLQAAIGSGTGIPIARQGHYPPEWMPAQILGMDLLWHGMPAILKDPSNPSKGKWTGYEQITALYSQPTYAQAEAILKRMAAFTHADTNPEKAAEHDRNKIRMFMLRQTYTALRIK